MRFLDLAKQTRRAVSDQSDQTRAQTDLSSLTSLLSHPKPTYTPGDGCSLHDISTEEVAARWRQLEAIISETPKDDQDAQRSVVAVCPCCCGPSRVETLLCRRCEDADLDELRRPPPCVDCGEPGITIEDAAWRCESHRSHR